MTTTSLERELDPGTKEGVSSTSLGFGFGDGSGDGVCRAKPRHETYCGVLPGAPFMVREVVA